MDARGFDQLAEGFTDGGDVIHEVVHDEAEVFSFFEGIAFGAEFQGFAGEDLFYRGFVDQGAFAVGPGDAEEAAAILVGDLVVEAFEGIHDAVGEGGGGKAA